MGVDHSNPYIHSTTVLVTLPSGVGPSCPWINEQPEPMEAKEERQLQAT